MFFKYLFIFPPLFLKNSKFLIPFFATFRVSIKLILFPEVVINIQDITFVANDLHFHLEKTFLKP